MGLCSKSSWWNAARKFGIYSRTLANYVLVSVLGQNIEEFDKIICIRCWDVNPSIRFSSSDLLDTLLDYCSVCFYHPGCFVVELQIYCTEIIPPEECSTKSSPPIPEGTSVGTFCCNFMSFLYYLFNKITNNIPYNCFGYQTRIHIHAQEHADTDYLRTVYREDNDFLLKSTRRNELNDQLARRAMLVTEYLTRHL